SEVPVSAPSAQIDAADDQFAVTGFQQAVHFADDPVQTERTALAAHVGNHTERAAIVATVLHFEIGTCPFIGGVEDRGSEEFGVRENVGDENRVLSSQFPVLSQACKRDE